MGRIIFPNIGCTVKSSVALSSSVKANRRRSGRIELLSNINADSEVEHE
jgi:hypothetical protein